MHKWKVEDWEKIFQADGTRKTAGVAVLVSGKTDFKPTIHPILEHWNVLNTQSKCYVVNCLSAPTHSLLLTD